MNLKEQSAQFENNPYQYTRGVRFRADPEPKRQGDLFKQKSSLTDSPIDLSELAKQLLDFHEELKDMLFYTNKEAGTAKAVSDSIEQSSPLKFQKGISINKSWLKTWHKNMFYLWIKDSGNKQGKYPLNNLRKSAQNNKNKQNTENFVQQNLENWIYKWAKKSQELKDLNKRPKDQKIRHSEIAETIRFFLNRSQWDYIYQFLTELSTKDVFQDQKITKLKNSLEKVRQILKQAEQNYVGSQSSGIEIAKASFNYFTLNKNPKNYENNLLKIRKKLDGFVYESESNSSSSEYSNIVEEKDKNLSTEENLKSQTLSQEKTKSGERENIFSIIERYSDNNKSYSWSYNPDWKDRDTKNQESISFDFSRIIFCFKSEQEQKYIERVCKICFKNRSEDPKCSKEEWSKKICHQCKREKSEKKSLLAHNTEKHIFLSLDQTYIAMKAFKAEQKSIFYELIAHIASGQVKSYEVKNQTHVLYHNIKTQDSECLDLRSHGNDKEMSESTEKSEKKEWCLPYNQMNFESISRIFSLFQFTEQPIKGKDKILDKILDSYKNQKNRVTKEKCYEAFLNITKKIAPSANKNNPTSRNISQHPNISRHPKHRFLSQRQNKFRDNKEIRPCRTYGKEDIKRAKKDRGAFLFGKNCYFKDYGNFCGKYKTVAQKRGQLIAQIKGIERERRESRQTDFWSLIYCDGDKKQLWLVPKQEDHPKKRDPSEKSLIQKARGFIYSQERQPYTKGASKYLCAFESLTMRTLHKLCFAEQSSFVLDMPPDLREMQKKAKEMKTDGDENNLKIKNKKKLKFLKEVLKNYAKTKLKLDHFDLQKIDKTENLEEFEKALEAACYFVKKVPLHESEKESFLKNFDVTVLNITSYDLEGKNKNTYQTPFTVSKNRRHTDLWLEFWESEMGESGFKGKERDVPPGKVRLNPELKIHYRKADKDLKSYFEKRDIPLKKKTNSEEFTHRGLREQFTAHFTLALNAGKKYDDLAFAKPEEILKKIQDFNKNFNQEMSFKTAWKYGVDRGNKELSTLCLAKFDPDKSAYEAEGENHIKPEFPNSSEDIKCRTLKKEKYNYAESYTTKEGKTKKRYAIKNLSYFVDDKYKDLFKQENATCLDLTTAKVIKGKIITNGDILTYLKLKKTVAKRLIYELYHKGQIDREAKLEWSDWEDGAIDGTEKHRPEGVLNIKTLNGEKTIYWYIKKYERIPLKLDEQSNTQIAYNKSGIEGALNAYLHQLRQNNNNHSPSISKINHLRDAITANMVGVICHLQKTYPGFIMLEDLSKDSINQHFFNSEENIARRLENALYKKFQTFGLVPPHVKDIIRLRESIVDESQRISDNRKIEKLKKDIQNRKKGLPKIKNDQEKRKLKKEILDKEKELSKMQSSLNGKRGNHSNSKGLSVTTESGERQNLRQIGAVVFVPEENTSKTCPYCGNIKKKTNEENQEEFKKRANDEKFRQHRFLCRNCGFDTYFFKEEEERVKDCNPNVDEIKRRQEFELFKDINDNDKVAAYNIAKSSLKK